MSIEETRARLTEAMRLLEQACSGHLLTASAVVSAQMQVSAAGAQASSRPELGEALAALAVASEEMTRARDALNVAAGRVHHYLETAC